MISILLMDKLSTDPLWLQLRRNQTLVVTWCDCVRTHPSVGQTWLRTRDTATSSSRASGGRGAGRGWPRSGTARRAPSTTRPSTSATSETGWQAVRQVRSLRFYEFFCYNIHRLLLALQHYLISNTESTPEARTYFSTIFGHFFKLTLTNIKHSKSVSKPFCLQIFFLLLNNVHLVSLKSFY